MKKFILTSKFFILFLFLYSTVIKAQVAGGNTNLTCELAIPVCPDLNFGVNIPNVLDCVDAETGPDYACLGSEPSPMWFYMRVSQSGNAIFDLTQFTLPDGEGEGLDVDFVLWGPFESEDACNLLTLENVVDCSYSGSEAEVIDFYTADPNITSVTENPSYVNAGDYYVLMVANYDNRYNSQVGDCNGQAGFVNLLPRYPETTAVFDCTIVGESYYFCDTDDDGQETVNLADYDEIILNGSQTSVVTYHLTSYDANNYLNPINGIQIITSDNPLTVYARLEDFATNTVEVIVLTFEVSDPPADQEVDPLMVCDPDGDGEAEFDLTIPIVYIGDNPDAEVLYYATYEDAVAGTNPIDNPDAFVSGNTTVYAVAGLGFCVSEPVEIELIIADEIALVPLTITTCNNEGSETLSFDLNDYTTDLLNNNSGDIFFYLDEDDANDGNDNIITDIDNFSTDGTVIYVRVSSGECFAVTTLTLDVIDAPEIVVDLDPIDICKTVTTDTEATDLTQIEEFVLVNTQDNFTTTYYTSLEDAEEGLAANSITNPTTYDLPEGSNTFYIRVENEEGCFSIAEFVINLNVGPVLNVDVDSLQLCDLDGDELVEFDLTSANVYSGTDPDVTLDYYTSLEDAIAGNSPIDDPSAYTSGSSTIYVIGFNGCLSVVPASFDIVIEDEPDLGAPVITICTSDAAVQIVVNLEDYTEAILNGNVGTLTFYEEEQDAIEGNTNNITDVQNYSTGSSVIYVRVEIGECYYITTITFSILSEPALVDIQDALYQCDNDGDGTETVDLTEIFDIIAPGLVGFDTNYYLTEASALNGDITEAISNPTNYDLPVGTHTFYIRVFLEDGCFSVGEFYYDVVSGPIVQDDQLYACDVVGEENFDLTQLDLSYVSTNTSVAFFYTFEDATNGDNAIADITNVSVNVPSQVFIQLTNDQGCFSVGTIDLLEAEAPDLSSVNTSYTLCSGNSIDLTVTNGFNYYLWSTGEEGTDVNSITVNELGNYDVTVTNAAGCSSQITINVTQGEAPMITDILVGPDNVTLTATGGLEPYEYSINGTIWQTSSQFNYLQPGIYTVYVRGDGCVSEAQELAIFDIPTLFTPNGDGYNDVWRIPGLQIYPESSIVIYDRFGKTVYTGTPTESVLWDGVDRSGNKVPTQDYWYTLDVTDGRKFTGHVTVKNRTEKGL